MTLDNAYTHQLLILDAGWIFYYLFWGAAALHPSMRELERPARDREPRLTWTRLALLTAATLIAPAIEIAKEVRRGDVDLIATITVSAMLFALVVMRMAGLIRQRERSIARERRLAAAAAQIVAATSREQIYDAALAAVPSLVDQNAVARALLHRRGHRRRGGARGRLSAGAEPVVHRPCCVRLAARCGRHLHRGGQASDGSPADIAFRLPADASDVLVVELPQHGERRARGLLLVCGEGAISVSARSGLLALATQVSLALESNTLTEELHRTAKRRRGSASLVQRAHDLITVVDENAVVIYQSPSVEQALGYTPEEVIGTRFDRLLVPGENTRLMRLLADGPGQGIGESETMECTLRHANGSARQFEITPHQPDRRRSGPRGSFSTAVTSASAKRSRRSSS